VEVWAKVWTGRLVGVEQQPARPRDRRQWDRQRRWRREAEEYQPGRAGECGLVATNNGARSLPWAVPNVPGLQNLLLRAQGAFTPTDAPGGIDVTNAVNLDLGL